MASTIVAEYSWERDSWTHHTDLRQTWRDAVAEVADKAKATLPECNGRVDSAVKIVLAGDVELLDDGKAKVASQTNGQTVYHIVNGACDCKDYPKAPSNWCKHRIAAGIQKRAMALAKQRLDDLDHRGSHGDIAIPQSASESASSVLPPSDASAPALPEAPASANVHVILAGRQVQVTLRDSDEQRLLARLEALLNRFPAEEKPEQAQPEGWCPKHNVQMRQNHKEGRSWYSHKTTDGQWCKGK